MSKIDEIKNIPATKNVDLKIIFSKPLLLKLVIPPPPPKVLPKPVPLFWIRISAARERALII